MKQFLLAIVVLLLIGTVAYAQQQTSSQITQDARQFLNQGQSNSSDFETMLADLNASNTSNRDALTFNRLRTEIERLEASINSEETRIKASLDNGVRVTPEMFNRVERLINQHKAKLEELEAFVNR